MIAHKYNEYRSSRKKTIDKDTISTKTIKTTDGWTNTDISNSKTDHASQDGNSWILSQLHHPSKEIKPKQIKENQSREICDKTEELKNLDHNQKYRNTVYKKAVAIIGDSILNVFINMVCLMNLSK